MMDTMTTYPVEWETFAQCPDCGGHRYQQEDAAGVYFQCEGEACEPLAPVDVLLEWDEVWAVVPDSSGRPALKVYALNMEEVEGA